jgi:hypothetical protein
VIRRLFCTYPICVRAHRSCFISAPAPRRSGLRTWLALNGGRMMRVPGRPGQACVIGAEEHDTFGTRATQDSDNDNHRQASKQHSHPSLPRIPTAANDRTFLSSTSWDNIPTTVFHSTLTSLSLSPGPLHSTSSTSHSSGAVLFHNLLPQVPLTQVHLLLLYPPVYNINILSDNPTCPQSGCRRSIANLHRSKIHLC